MDCAHIPSLMRTYHFVALRGPNRWSPTPILEVHDVGFALEDLPAKAASVAGILQAFLEAKQFTTSHPQSVANAESVVRRIASGVSGVELWLQCARWFSAMAGVPTRDFPSAIELRSPTSSTNDSASSAATNVFAIEMEEQSLTEKCVRFARDWLTSEAPLIDFPLGRHQRRIWTAETDATSAIAEAIASDKDLTKRLLRQVGVPVPLGRAVTSAEDAWLAANEIGFPIVVKPCNANHQRGISIELSTKPEILKAYDWAVKDGETNDILVEQFALGHHHRLLVVGNRLVAAAKGHSECVVGDGMLTIEQLVAKENQDPRRGEAYTDPLGVIKLTEPAIIELSKQGFQLHSIPAIGKRVVVQRTGDLTTDCTEDVHPETAEQAVLAARVVGLDIAGLDILATDISVPLSEQRGAVVEVNAGPSLSPHVSPLYGKPQKVGDAIVAMLFPENEQGHIKIIGVVKSPSSDVLIQQFAEQLRLRNVDFGMLSHGQAGFNGRVVDTGCVNDEERVVALLCNPILSALIVQIDIDQSAQFGVCTPRLDHLLFSIDSIPSNLPDASLAGIRAILNAVPQTGRIFGDRLPASAYQIIETWKKEGVVSKNSLERAFEIGLDC